MKLRAILLVVRARRCSSSARTGTAFPGAHFPREWCPESRTCSRDLGHWPFPPPRPPLAGQPIALASQPTPQAARNAALPQVALAPTSIANVSAPAYAPLQPPRPLDLMTIPGADTPIAAPRRRVQPTFFAPPSPVAETLIQRRPFDGVDLGGLQPLR